MASPPLFICVVSVGVLAKDRISMLLVYPKSEQDALSTDQVKQLRKALEI
jgi:hypothetical protein